MVALNRAVAVAMADGPGRRARLIDELAATGELAGYHLLPPRAPICCAASAAIGEAAAAYREALALVGNEADRRFLERRLASLT